MYYFADTVDMMGRESKIDDIADMKPQYTRRQAVTGKNIHVLGLSPCKTSKVAMLRNNLVGMLTVESRCWSHRKTGKLVIVNSLTFYNVSRNELFEFWLFFLL